MVRTLYKHFLLTAMLVVSISASSFAQGTTDEQLAAHYYREGAFDKAVLYYERLYDKQASEETYRYYLNCLLALEDFKSAEKLTRTQAKNNSRILRYQVDVGNVLLRAQEDGKANKQFDKIIKDLNKASVTQILDLGRAFTEINQDDRALEVYYTGRKQIGNSYPFHFQIAAVLGQKGDTEGMINEYLDVLEVSRSYLQNVQNTLNRVIGFEEENKYNSVLQEQLLKRVQKSPEDDVYAQMLIWMYIKQDKFEGAMLQAKALDKRNKEDGERILKLADLSLNNYRYDVAIDGYTYVKSKGIDNYHYITSAIGLLKSLKEKVTNTSYNPESIGQLVGEYESILEELGYRATTWEIIKDYAHIKAFFQSRYAPEATKEAIEVLNDAILLPGLSEQQLARLKMELADIYMIANRIWDASLLYGQIEKKFKHDELGFEAKLKNAKVFYYSGDFGWSDAQLEALKGSTSKLISNDALELSAFISENTGLDTTMDALALFSKSELMVVQHKFDSAMFFLDLVEKNYPGHEIADDLLFQIGRIKLDQNKPEEALRYFLDLVDIYPNDILADNALIEAARISELKLLDTQKAMELYEQILTDYPSSLFVVEARKRYRGLRGDNIQ